MSCTETPRDRGFLLRSYRYRNPEFDLEETYGIGPTSVADLRGALADPTLSPDDPPEWLAPTRPMSRRDRDLLEGDRRATRSPSLLPSGISAARVRQVLLAA